VLQGPRLGRRSHAWRALEATAAFRVRADCARGSCRHVASSGQKKELQLETSQGAERGCSAIVN
jgi:hypothetical protein